MTILQQRKKRAAFGLPPIAIACLLAAPAMAQGTDVPIGNTGYSFNTDDIRAASVTHSIYNPNDPTNYLQARLFYWELGKAANPNAVFTYSPAIVNGPGPDAILFVYRPSKVWGGTQGVQINGQRRDVWANVQLSGSRPFSGVFGGLVDLSDFGVAPGASINRVQIFASSQNTEANYNANLGRPPSDQFGNYSDTYNAGFGPINRSAVATASVGNKVFFDNNGDGVIDPANISTGGADGVTVQLKNAAGRVLDTTVTRNSGSYVFNNLEAGEYRVGVDLSTLPSGYELTTKDAGTDDLRDSDADPDNGMSDVFTLDEGQRDFSWDFGIRQVHIPQERATIGNRVWNDKNSDGIQNNNEPGLEGVLVILRDEDGVEVARRTTNSVGRYIFNGLEPGTYSLQFSLANLPNVFEFTTMNAGGNRGRDSDANPTNGRTELTQLDPGERDVSWDAGVRKREVEPPVQASAKAVTIVWRDLNRSGILNSGEPRVAGVRVELRDADGNVVAAKASNDKGRAFFGKLPAGTYQFCFDASTYPAGTEPTRFQAGNGRQIDSDVDASNCTPLFDLADDEKQTRLDLGLRDQNV